MKKEMARRLATCVKDVQCPNCKRISEVPLDTVIHFCGCGVSIDLKKREVEGG